MYDLRPPTKERRSWPIVLLALIVLAAIPFAFAGLLIVSAFLKGFLGW